MNTAEFLGCLLDRLPGDCVIVSGLGRTSEELYRLAPDRTLFTDTMGDVASLSAGVAIAARPLTVAGIDTDGSFLMNLSVLMALGAELPLLDNYRLAILDNGQYESAGGLPSRRAALDWRKLFAAVGLAAIIVRTVDDLPPGRLPPGPVIVAKITNEGPVPGAAKPIDGVESSYAIEKVIAEHLGRPARRPAVKP